MKRVFAVYHKEMLAYFRSPIAYFVVAVFLVGTGYFFYLQHVSLRQRVDGRDVPQHGDPSSDGDPAGLHAAVLR